MKQKLNYMNSIAQAYKLALGDKFNVIYTGSDSKFGPYFLCEDGMYDTTGKEYPITLMSIVSGECFVEKVPEFAKPIKCKEDDDYVFIDEEGFVVRRTFYDSTLDYLLMKSGNMFDINAIIPGEQIVKIISEMKGE